MGSVVSGDSCPSNSGDKHHTSSSKILRGSLFFHVSTSVTFLTASNKLLDRNSLREKKGLSHLTVSKGFQSTVAWARDRDNLHRSGSTETRGRMWLTFKGLP